MPIPNKRTPAGLDEVPQLLTGQHVRDRLDISKGTLQSLVRAGSLRQIRLPSGGFRYPIDDVAAIAVGAVGAVA